MSALIWTPFENEEQAHDAASTLLEEGLVACANIVANMQSMFLWQDKVQQAEECGVLFKTDAKLLASAVQRLEQLHPYETPAIMGWECPAAAGSTREWLSQLPGAGGNSADEKT